METIDHPLGNFHIKPETNTGPSCNEGSLCRIFLLFYLIHIKYWLKGFWVDDT